MRLSTVFAVILGLVALVVGGVVVFLATLDVGRYKDDIIAMVENQTGRRVVIQGDLDLSLGLSPALVVDGVRLGNAPWASDPDMVTVGHLEAQVEILPLLSGELRILRLVLADASVWLETDADGRGNWALSPPETASAEGDGTGGGDQGDENTASAGNGTSARLDIQDVRLENAILTMRDGATDRTLLLELDHAVLTGAGVDAPLQVDLAGRYNGLDFSTEGTLGSLAALGAPTTDSPQVAPWPLDLTAQVAGATLTVDGTIAHPVEARGLDLTVSARGARLADLAQLGPVIEQDLTLPPVGAYDVTLRLTGDAASLAVPSLTASLGTLPLLKVQANGSIDNLTAADGIALSLSAEGGEVADLMPLANGQEDAAGTDLPMLGPFRVTASVTGSAAALAVQDIDIGVGPPDGLRLTATGAVADALAASGIALDVALNAPDPARLADLGVPVSVPVQAKAHVSDISGGYRIADLSAALGSSRIGGSLDATLDGPRPRVAGTLSGPLLDLAELTGAPGGSAQAGGSGDTTTASPATPAQQAPAQVTESRAGGTLIPDTPLPLDALSAADADLTIHLDKAVLPNGLPLTAVDVGVTLADGALTLDPLRTGLADGTLAGTISVTPVGNGTATVRIDLSGDAISLGALADSLGHGDMVEGGSTKLRLTLTGRGATPHQIAGSLDGHVLVHTTDAVMNNTLVDWAGGDVISQLMRTVNPFSQEERTTPMRCAVVNLTAEKGVLFGDYGLAMETDRMAVSGGGAFDLGAERLNVKVAPAAREGVGLERGLGRIVELFAVNGPFTAPTLVLDANEAVRTGLRTAASAIGAVATGGLSLVGEDLLMGEGSAEMEPCLVALGEKEPGQGDGGSDDTSVDGTLDAVGEALGGDADAVREQAEDALEGLRENLPDNIGGGLRNLFE